MVELILPTNLTTDTRRLRFLIMVQANSHDDVYDRQIRLWGADAQVRMLVSMGLPGLQRNHAALGQRYRLMHQHYYLHSFCELV